MEGVDLRCFALFSNFFFRGENGNDIIAVR